MVILPYEIFTVGKLCYVLVTERWVGMEEILAHGNACLIIVFDTGLYLLLQSLKLKDGWEVGTLAHSNPTLLCPQRAQWRGRSDKMEESQ